ncbi:methyl-accepting chemotaxis protein [Salinicola halophilus]|uniref:methyl-accepting chemotaxis protein n=1 Tax=Salinicola halophilus TaxID=184065 RepID=UPI0013A6032F|nr:methyl-accepting chemotaxis protein [Salinicola halophilus]
MRLCVEGRRGRSVKTKLFLSLGFMILLMAGIGLEGIMSNRATQGAMEQIVERELATMIDLSTVRATIGDNRTILAAAGDEPLTPEQRAEVEANRARTDEAWNRYYPAMVDSDSERETAGAYLASLNDLRALLDSGRASEEQINAAYTQIYELVTTLYRGARDSVHDAYESSVTAYELTRNLTTAVLLIGILLAIAIGVWLARGILRPLSEATAFSQSLAAGDLGSRVSNVYRDEFGTLLGAMIAMRDRLTGVIGEVARNAKSVESVSNELAASNENLSQRTQEQAASLQQTASALEEITNTVKQNADNASEADQLAGAVSSSAQEGGAVVGEAITAMQEIDSSSKRISNIIGMIDEIAFQTNLLALNASVEAARAGEQGRGFAVVAQEVRQLASRSANAAGEIKQLVSESAERVRKGSELVQRSGETLTEIVSSVEKVTSLVSEIATASREQSAGIQQINLAVGEMDSVTQQNASLVEESTTVTSHLQTQAESLAREIGFFRNFETSTPTRANATASSRSALAPAPAPAPAPMTSVPTPRTPAKRETADAEEWSEF